jgi:methylmalonyl-CoA/ethylmalonyl-CoA epimerase
VHCEASAKAKKAKNEEQETSLIMVLAHPFELKYHHAGVSVPDLESSIAWYSNMLGFELVKRDYLAHIKAKVAFLRRDDMRVELFEVAGAAPMSEDRRGPDRDLYTHGNKHISYAVKDVRAAAEALKLRGVDIVFVIEVGPGVTVCYIRDNAGNLIELTQQPDLWN